MRDRRDVSRFAASLLLLPAIAPNVPSFNLWLIPFVTLAGGVSVVVSARRDPGSLTVLRLVSETGRLAQK
jgi:hypothetical protein